jgi:hypothetical protein
LQPEKFNKCTARGFRGFVPGEVGIELDRDALVGNAYLTHVRYFAFRTEAEADQHFTINFGMRGAGFTRTT